MAITFGQVKTWKAAPLGDAGDGLKADLRNLETSRDELEANGVAKSWTGAAADAARGHRDTLVKDLGSHITAKQGMQKALYTAEPEVEAIERLVQGILDRAKTQEFTVGDDGSVTSTATPPTFKSRFEAEEWGNSRQTIAQELADEIEKALAKAVGVDAILARGLPTGIDEQGDEYGRIDPAIAEKWETLSIEERKAVLEEMVKKIAAESGVDMPTIDWSDLGNDTWDDGSITYGYWNDEEPTMALNPNVLDDPGQLINTVAHEVRHGRQHEAIDDKNDWQFWWEDDPFDEHKADGITEQQAEEWEENFDDYKSTDNGATFDEYYNQPVEKDARNAGRDYLNNLTEEEFNRILEESR
ncbi:hypothetical protein SAMN05428985_105370 [Nocardioides sp. YR527]|uniref:hypothetical protein n=1 Tax=Nocardioides sp. YR527 TaxID=1881028 RepID=UPI00088CE93E|nr:hypothetical protein [Nocardioides sp. YR527]SDK70442.1 hypothetical protein SAMN05428985_105370 [Nocardioides sp. YR527]